MIYSKTCEYAIRALSYIAKKGSEPSVTSTEVSRHTHVPKAYVAKIFQCLVKADILSSRRGPMGGFALVMAPADLTVLKVIQAVEDPSKSFLSGCVMGLNQCDDHTPCPLHFVWTKTKEAMIKNLLSCTMEDIAKVNRKFKTGKHSRYTLSKKMRKVFKT